MFALMLAAGLSLLQIEQTEVACWAKAPDSETAVLSCAVAVGGKVVNGVSSPPLKVVGDQDPEDLAQAYCILLTEALKPRPEAQQISTPVSPWVHQ